MAKGFVYVLSNSAFKGLLKIGYSRKVPGERALELDTTGVPSPFVVEYYCLVEGDAELEWKVHRALEATRHRPGREFFRVDLSEAIGHIQKVCPNPEHVWSRTPPTPETKTRTPPPPETRTRPPNVECPKCHAKYVVAKYCPLCQIELKW